MSFNPTNTKLRQEPEASAGAEQKKPRLTNSTTALNRTTVDPVSVRFTAHERAELENWIADLQAYVGKPLSKSQVLRALVHMRQHVKVKRLIESIKENT